MPNGEKNVSLQCSIRVVQVAQDEMSHFHLTSSGINGRTYKEETVEDVVVGAADFECPWIFVPLLPVGTVPCRKDLYEKEKHLGDCVPDADYDSDRYRDFVGSNQLHVRQ